MRIRPPASTAPQLGGLADEELMVRVRRADPQAFAAVYDRHCDAAGRGTAAVPGAR